MADWKKSRTYCCSCRRWAENVEHLNCPYGSRGSLTWVDLDNLRMGCGKCKRKWLIEDDVMHCTCGYIQHTEYGDSNLDLAVGDEVIDYYDDLVYIRRRSGIVTVGYRTYYNQSYV